MKGSPDNLDHSISLNDTKIRIRILLLACLGISRGGQQFGNVVPLDLKKLCLISNLYGILE